MCLLVWCNSSDVGLLGLERGDGIVRKDSSFVQPKSYLLVRMCIPVVLSDAQNGNFIIQLYYYFNLFVTDPKLLVTASIILFDWMIDGATQSIPFGL
jgi:hypothetical protein